MQQAFYPASKEEEYLFFASQERIWREVLWLTHNLSMTQGRIGIQTNSSCFYYHYFSNFSYKEC